MRFDQKPAGEQGAIKLLGFCSGNAERRLATSGANGLDGLKPELCASLFGKAQPMIHQHNLGMLFGFVFAFSKCFGGPDVGVT